MYHIPPLMVSQYHILYLYAIMAILMIFTLI